MNMNQLHNRRHAANTVVVLLLLTACVGPRNEESAAHKPVGNEVATEPAHPVASVDEKPSLFPENDALTGQPSRA